VLFPKSKDEQPLRAKVLRRRRTAMQHVQRNRFIGANDQLLMVKEFGARCMPSGAAASITLADAPAR
jgi:hypothetical protein